MRVRARIVSRRRCAAVIGRAERACMHEHEVASSRLPSAQDSAALAGRLDGDALVCVVSARELASTRVE